jgi:hypothetical protein
MAKNYNLLIIIIVIITGLLCLCTWIFIKNKIAYNANINNIDNIVNFTIAECKETVVVKKCAKSQCFLNMNRKTETIECTKCKYEPSQIPCSELEFKRQQLKRFYDINNYDPLLQFFTSIGIIVFGLLAFCSSIWSTFTCYYNRYTRVNTGRA